MTAFPSSARGEGLSQSLARRDTELSGYLVRTDLARQAGHPQTRRIDARSAGTAGTKG